MRRGRYVITGDVEAMFMRIKVKLEDCAALRIFFRENEGLPMRVLEGRKHLFGLACSPFVAVMTMKHHALINAKKWPVAAEVIMTSMMVNDFCVSAESVSTLQVVKTEMRQLCSSMGMKIHKYAANHSELLEDVPTNEMAKTMEIGDPEDHVSPYPELPNIKTLGMLWVSREDVFRFQWEPVSTTTWTKREICSVAGRFFDPIGPATPVTIFGKLIIQQLWRMELDWDEVIQGEPIPEWELYLKNLAQVEMLRIPRWVGGSSVILLVGFADASLVAQAAVIYAVAQEEGGGR